MKIALVCPRTPRESFAGIENLVIQVGKGLNARGVHVSVVTTAEHPKPSVFEEISVQEFPRWAPSENYFLSPELVKGLEKGKWDIIHCFGYNNLITFMVMAKKKKDQCLVVSPASAGTSSLFRKMLLFPYRHLFNWYSKNIDAVVFLSEFEKNLFLKDLRVNPTNTWIIPIGVDQRFIDSIKVQKKHEIVSVGRLVKNKGFDRLLQIFAIISKKDPGLRLRIIGKGVERVTLEHLAKELGIQDKVDFMGEIPFSRRTELFTFLKQAKAFVFLSKYESQGVVISEAIASKTPAIIFPNSAQKEFIDQGWAVGVSENDTNENIAEKIFEVVSNPDEFVSKENPPSIEEIIQRHQELYEKLKEKK